MIENYTSLKDLSVDLTAWLDEKLEHLREFNHFEWEPWFDGESLQYTLETVDAYRLSDQWYARFKGGCVWFGVLSYFPWYRITESDKYGYLEEEDIWQIILEHHVEIDSSGGLRAKFKFNPDSPLNGWLRTWAKENEVIVNLDTLIYFAVKAIIELDWSSHYPSTLHFEQVGYCPNCEFSSASKDCRCYECKGELEYEQ
jgi:hypothetical protein